MQPEEREWNFSFDIDHYIVLAQIMLKIDLNLKKSRHELVPEMITEDDFWHNYFYKIECLKKDLGVQGCRLGQRITVETRARQLKAKKDKDDKNGECSSSGEDEEAAVAQSTATLKQSKQSSAVEMKTLSTRKSAAAVQDENSSSDGENSIDRSATTEAYLNQSSEVPEITEI